MQTNNNSREFKLGMHSYTLHLSGCGESWGFQTYGQTHAFDKTINMDKLMDIANEIGIDVLHVTLVDLDNNTSESHLKEIQENAKRHHIDLELNVSFDAPSDPRVNSTVKDALTIGHLMGAQLVKFSLDIKRSTPTSHSCMCPEVKAQLIDRYEAFKECIPLMEKYNMKIAIENHCDTFSDEIIWLVKKLGHPLIGACCDTINSLVLMEGIEECVRKMAPYSYCVHFCDNKIIADPDGTHSIGTAIGQGDVDCKKIIEILREQAPKELDTIDLEIELPLSGHTIEEGREIELKALKESVVYMRNELKIGKGAIV